MIAPRPPRSIAALALALTTLGCSRALDDLPREPVAGAVTMDGQPLPEGVIQFYPQGAATAASTGANATIKDGRYAIPRESGLVPGPYKVSVSHAELKEIDAKGRKKATPTRSKQLGPEQIPARYNTKSELTAEIKPGGAKDLDFALKSK